MVQSIGFECPLSEVRAPSQHPPSRTSESNGLLTNLLNLVPLYRSEVPDRTRRLRCRDFRSAVLPFAPFTYLRLKEFAALSLRAGLAMRSAGTIQPMSAITRRSFFTTAATGLAAGAFARAARAA